ncbi:MAG: hypothetical protein ACYTFW_24800 [Planctomycetota bacterium]|jgi:hypothetical protein
MVSFKNRSIIYITAPAFFFFIAVIAAMAGLLTDVPQEFMLALNLTAIFSMFLALCLFGQAGIQAVET